MMSLSIARLTFLALCSLLIIGSCIGHTIAVDDDCGCDDDGDNGGTDDGSGGDSSSDSSSSDSGSSSRADDAVVWRMKGEDLYRKGLFNESLAAYEKATETDPYVYMNWIGMGRVLLAMNKSQEAGEAFKIALRLDPGNTEPYILLGDALRAGGNPDEAVTQYRKALAMNPNLGEVKEKIASAETGSVIGNVSETPPLTTTVSIPQSEPASLITSHLSVNTSSQTLNTSGDTKASLPGLGMILIALITGSIFVFLRKK